MNPLQQGGWGGEGGGIGLLHLICTPPPPWGNRGIFWGKGEKAEKFLRARD